jgi:hypothetical protein
MRCTGRRAQGNAVRAITVATPPSRGSRHRAWGRTGCASPPFMVRQALDCRCQRPFVLGCKKGHWFRVYAPQDRMPGVIDRGIHQRPARLVRTQRRPVPYHVLVLVHHGSVDEMSGGHFLVGLNTMAHDQGMRRVLEGEQGMPLSQHDARPIAGSSGVYRIPVGRRKVWCCRPALCVA